MAPRLSRAPHRPATRSAPTHPPRRWARATSLLATFYLAVLLWLGLFVIVPMLGSGLKPVAVTSGSMQPAIRTGDIVMLRGRDDATALPVGTVVTFDDPARPGTLTTHRVVGTTPDGRYRTRGDANAASDSTPVDPAAVVGTGRLIVPIIGLPLVWLQTTPVLLVLWVAITSVAMCVGLRLPRTFAAVPTATA